MLHHLAISHRSRNTRASFIEPAAAQTRPGAANAWLLGGAFTLLPPRKPKGPPRTGGRSFFRRLPPDSPLPLPREPGVLRPELRGDWVGDACLPPVPPPTPWVPRLSTQLSVQWHFVPSSAGMGSEPGIKLIEQNSKSMRFQESSWSVLMQPELWTGDS